MEPVFKLCATKPIDVNDFVRNNGPLTSHMLILLWERITFYLQQQQQQQPSGTKVGWSPVVLLSLSLFVSRGFLGAVDVNRQLVERLRSDAPQRLEKQKRDHLTKKKKKRQNSSKHYGPAETMFTCRFLAIAEKATNNFNEENKLIAFVDFWMDALWRSKISAFIKTLLIV